MDYSKDLGTVRNIMHGKGILGWIVKKFFRKKQTAEFAGLFGEADNQLGAMHTQNAVAQAGTPAKALVLKIEDTGMLVNNRPVAVVSLRVKPENADEFDATVKTIVSRFNFPRPDDVIDVKYNPQNTGEVAITG